MASEPTRLLDPRSVTAAQVMTKDVQTLHEDATIAEALEVLSDYGVSGVPVVDAVGRLVGVFSLSDLVKHDQASNAGEAARARGYFSFDPFVEGADDDDGVEDWAERDGYDENAFARDTVGDWMTRDLKTVTPEVSVAEVARVMVKERIHRVLVLDGGRLKGIVTTFDVVRLLAGSAGPGDGES